MDILVLGIGLKGFFGRGFNLDWEEEMFVRRSLVTPSVDLVSKVQFSHPQSEDSQDREDSKDDPILRGRVEKISGFTSRCLSKVLSMIFHAFWYARWSKITLFWERITDCWQAFCQISHLPCRTSDAKFPGDQRWEKKLGLDSQIIRAKYRVPIFTLAGWKIANFNGFNFNPEQSFILASLSSSNEV